MDVYLVSIKDTRGQAADTLAAFTTHDALRDFLVRFARRQWGYFALGAILGLSEGDILQKFYAAPSPWRLVMRKVAVEGPEVYDPDVVDFTPGELQYLRALVRLSAERPSTVATEMGLGPGGRDQVIKMRPVVASKLSD